MGLTMQLWKNWNFVVNLNMTKTVNLSLKSIWVDWNVVPRSTNMLI